MPLDGSHEKHPRKSISVNANENGEEQIVVCLLLID